jgi:aldose 1-epimerase
MNKNSELTIEYRAVLDGPCPVSLTNHAYFNLKGEGKGSILDHELSLNCSRYLPVNDESIPVGNLCSVEGTPFDFRSPKLIGRDIAEIGSGYDHCFVVDGDPGVLRPCARVVEKTTGRIMTVFTTHPGVQFYTGNNLNDTIGKNGSIYSKHSGFCLETQHFPDSPNQSAFLMQFLVQSGLTMSVQYSI